MSCQNLQCNQGRNCDCGEPYRAVDFVIALIGVMAIALVMSLP